MGRDGPEESDSRLPVTRRRVLQTGLAGATGAGVLTAATTPTTANIEDLPTWRYGQTYAVGGISTTLQTDYNDTPRMRPVELDDDRVGVRDVDTQSVIHTVRGLSHVNTRLPDSENVVADECAGGPGVQHRFVASTMSYGVDSTYTFDPSGTTTPTKGTRGRQSFTGPLITGVDLETTDCGPVSFAVNNAFRGGFRYGDIAGSRGSPVVERQGLDTTVNRNAVRSDVETFVENEQVVNPELPTDEPGLLAIADLTTSGAGIALGGAAAAGLSTGPAAIIVAVVGAGILALDLLFDINEPFPGTYDFRQDGIDIGPEAPSRADVLLSYVDFTVTVPPGESAELTVSHQAQPDRIGYVASSGPLLRDGYENPDQVIAEDTWNVEIPALGLDDDPTDRLPSVARDTGAPEPEIRFTVEKGSDNDGRKDRQAGTDDSVLHHADLEDVGDSDTTDPVTDSDTLAFVASETDPVTFEALYDTPEDDVAMVRWDIIKDVEPPRPVHRHEQEFTRRHDAWTDVGRESVEVVGDDLVAEELDYSSGDTVPDPSRSAYGPGEYIVVLTVQTERGTKGTAQASFRVDDEMPSDLVARIDASEDTLDPTDSDQELELDASDSELPDDPEAVAYEWRLWPLDDDEPIGDVTQRFGETVDDALDDVGLVGADELAVELTLWVSDRHSSDGALQTQVEDDRDELEDTADDSEFVLVDDAETTLDVEADSEPDAAFDVRPADPTNRDRITFDASPTESGGDAIEVTQRFRWTFERFGVEDPGPVERNAAEALDEDLVAETFHRPEEPLDADELEADDVDGPAEFRSITEQLEPAEYRVSLRAVDVPGGSDATAQRITVEDATELDVSIERLDDAADPDAIPPGEEARFAAVVDDDDVDPDNLEYQWRGAVSGTEREISFTPEERGEYRLEVEITDPPTAPDIDVPEGVEGIARPAGAPPAPPPPPRRARPAPPPRPDPCGPPPRRRGPPPPPTGSTPRRRASP